MFSHSILLTNLVIAFLCSLTSAAPIEDRAAKPKTYAAIPTLVGTPVAIGPGTYPRSNKLSDGSLIAAYTAFEGGNNIIRIALSTNNGKTWFIPLLKVYGFSLI